MAKKFARKAFILWLDALARLCVFTRDEFTCQMQLVDDCYGSSFPTPQDRHCSHIITRQHYNTRWDLVNLTTGCSRCHGATHQDSRLGCWFKDKYPQRDEYLTWAKAQTVVSSWKEWDFKKKEGYLLEKCVDLEVDPANMANEQFRIRLIRKLAEAQ